METPLKQAATSQSVLTEIQPLTTPPKPKETPPADPWTPTSNLKMLISAVSPEIRSRDQRRELSNNTRDVLPAKPCLQVCCKRVVFIYFLKLAEGCLFSIKSYTLTYYNFFKVFILEYLPNISQDIDQLYTTGDILLVLFHSC